MVSLNPQKSTKILLTLKAKYKSKSKTFKIEYKSGRVEDLLFNANKVTINFNKPKSISKSYLNGKIKISLNSKILTIKTSNQKQLLRIIVIGSKDKIYMHYTAPGLYTIDKIVTTPFFKQYDSIKNTKKSGKFSSQKSVNMGVYGLTSIEIYFKK